ncbi:hypothetical protein DBR32_06610 [Taibaiella sp. KBW10]|uniref:PSP1 domain-containing protein n=1 Tax=Taibaiella sp. KBW10 TaxID=2153357 RepID=UPI000F5AD6A2|nr:regulatory iron-sulfur-containing complex subunit RicT [Taibaiella sp. KBW10]RQO31620.1 hypothetical protein DBR32_06610 [Taibaiella sp. KBW10]
MGCGSCGVSSGEGKTSGCQSGGGCSSGGCNRLNVFNWLAEIPLSDFGKPYNIIEVSFNRGSRKDYFKNNTNIFFDKGEMVAVEGVGGFDVGEISLTGELVKLQLKKYSVTEDGIDKKILRTATDNDLNVYYQQKEIEKSTMIRSRAIAKQLNLEMKIAEAEWQADGKKITFFYTADSRVDFRELIKVYAGEFKAKIEMRQIGARQESAKVGGIGSCGRELCCSSWLSDFKTVNTTAARYQNLSINQTKLSGQCGRLKCCLNYELDTYMDSLKGFPPNADSMELQQGRAFLQKKDIFKNLMWYSFAGSNKQYPLTIERVKEILLLNAKGEKPEELEAVEIQVKNKDPEKTVDMGFVNDVGQIKLSSLKGNNNNKKRKKPQQGGDQRPRNAEQSAQGEGREGRERVHNREPREAREPRVKTEGGGQGPQGQQRNNRPKPPQNRNTETKAPNTGGGQQRQRDNNPKPMQTAAPQKPTGEQKNRNPEGHKNREGHQQNNKRRPNRPNNQNTEQTKPSE